MYTHRGVEDLKRELDTYNLSSLSSNNEKNKCINSVFLFKIPKKLIVFTSTHFF